MMKSSLKNSKGDPGVLQPNFLTMWENEKMSVDSAIGEISIHEGGEPGSG